jgi:hypothetical protein
MELGLEVRVSATPLADHVRDGTHFVAVMPIPSTGLTLDSFHKS